MVQYHGSLSILVIQAHQKKTQESCRQSFRLMRPAAEQAWA
jgi:hypothetical protein